MTRCLLRLISNPVLGFSVALLVSACTDQPTEPGPAELVIIQAPSTVGAPGWELIDTLIVRAVDPSGTPRAGVKVTWAVRQGGGSIAPTAEATDADGYAKAVWTLGSTAGENQVRASTLEGSQAEFESTGEAFRVDRVASSDDLACGLIRGAVWCWGKRFWASSTPPSVSPRLFVWSIGPGLVDDSHAFVDLAVAGAAVCALDPLQDVWCATAENPLMSPQGGLPALRTLTGSQAGSGGPGERLCGLATVDSTAWCWVPGDASTELSGSPHFAALWMSVQFACGLLADSTAACWGESPPGDGSTSASDTAVAVSGGHRFVELAVGRDFACGRSGAGEVWCWGRVHPPPDALIPVPVASASYRLGVTETWVGSFTLGGTMEQWQWGGSAKRFPGVASGLEGLPVASFAQNNSLACAHLADQQVYCYDEMWDNSSSDPYNSYSPAQPVRQIPQAAPAP